MQGLKMAALYGILPHKLGFCGPKKKSKTKALLDYLYGKKISQEKIRKILKNFKGAYHYYKLIAKCNKIPDPFNQKVVKAYWIGNELLERVKISDLRQMIRKDFSKPGLLKKEIALKKSQEIPSDSKPHHNFHVLILGPVSRKIILKGKLLNLCRIGWGKVRTLGKNKVQVKYCPLNYRKELKLGKLIEKEIGWDGNLLPDLKLGDCVSIHWNQAIQRLKKKEVENLKKYTKITLEGLTQQQMKR